MHRAQRVLERLRRLEMAEARFALAAWVIAPRIVARLRREGLEATLGCLDVPGWVSSLAGAVDPKLGSRAVMLAFRAQPLAPSACLGRALVQHGLHRAHGTPHRFVVGVRKMGAELGAHAWVDDGVVAGDAEFSPILLREFT